MARIAMLANVQTSLRSLYILVIQAREDTVLPENDGLQTAFSKKTVQRYSVSTLCVLSLLGLSACDNVIGDQVGKPDKLLRGFKLELVLIQDG